MTDKTDEKKNLTPEEIEKVKNSEELSDENLEDAAGGRIYPLSNYRGPMITV